MSFNLPSQPPEHPVEFNGNVAPGKQHKSLKKWIVSWRGGLLLIVVGNAIGALVWVVAIGTQPVTTDDVAHPLKALLNLALGTIVGSVAGSIVGLLVWNKLRTRARESGEIE